MPAEIIDSTPLRQHVHLGKRTRSLILTASRASVSKHRDRDNRLAAAARELCDFADERSDQAMDLGARFLARRTTLDPIAPTAGPRGQFAGRQPCAWSAVRLR